MLLVASLASFVLLVTEAAANPVVIRNNGPSFKLSISKQVIGKSNGTVNVTQGDRALLMNFANGGTASLFSTPNVPLTDNVLSYVATVGIGSPATNYDLVVDTASANTWVGAGKPYQGTTTSVKTPDSVKVSYGSAYFTGTEYTDTLTIAPDAVITQQAIGVASASAGFANYDGVLAIGPNGLSRGSLSPDGTSVTPTVTDNLFTQNIIQNNFVAISLQPTTSSSQMNGVLMFGAIDTTRTTESPTAFPLTITPPASNYWGIDATFRYGDGTPLLDTTGSGIVDSRISAIYLATDAYHRYVDATGAELDNDTGFLCISKAKYGNLKSLYLDIGASSYELTPNAQIWPRVQNSAIGGKEGRIYLVIQNIGQSVPGLDFILGTAFMERFYVVLDTGGQRLGLAKTPFTYADSN